MIVKVIYDDGVFRPERPVNIEQGARFEVLVQTAAEHWETKDVARALRDVAATPAKVEDSFSGEDHDQVLYGENGAW